MDPIEEDDFMGNRNVIFVKKIKAHDRACLSLDASSDGQFLISVGGDNKLCLF